MKVEKKIQKRARKIEFPLSKICMRYMYFEVCMHSWKMKHRVSEFVFVVV